MDFGWDPSKRASNLTKHGVDFLVATQIVLEPHYVAPIERSEGEQRWMAVGSLPPAHVPSQGSGMLCTVVYTRRGDTYRMISAR
jgi:hypothetical protein